MRMIEYSRLSRMMPGPKPTGADALPEKLKLGLIVGLTENVEESFHEVTRVGLTTCQLCCWTPAILNESLAAKVREASKRTGVIVSSYWAGHTGKTTWNFIDGPRTIGLVPRETRAERLAELRKGADFARMIGAPSITTHVGFIPEDLNDSNYSGVIDALRELAQHCKKLGLDFLFETGQETPVTLIRAFEDIGTDNLGVNLDPANLILYGKANPVDALDVFGKYVKGMHAKDGKYPTDGKNLGKEAAIGQGKVDFAKLIAGLKGYGFRGPITIEREISGPQQIEDIKESIRILTPML
jgi:sugar phosphate isomerase/epimerase